MQTALLLALVAIFLLLVLSAFFSAAETSLTTASRARMHALSRKGNRRAGTVEWLNQRRDRLLSSVLLGNNLVNILASALATSVLIRIFGDAGVAYATALMTVLVLVFAEILPKTYALRHAERTALALAPLVRLIVGVLAPVSAALHAVVQGILRITGNGAAPVDAEARDEIRGAIELFAREAGFVGGERNMLGGILDLPTVEVSEIMVHRTSMFVVDANLPPAKIVSTILEEEYSRVPLFKDQPDNIVGVLHIKDLVRALAQRRGELDGLDVLSLAKEPWFIPETTTLREQLTAFRRRKAHFALVVDEYGALMGVVTLEDILEEIVGEISDEHDVGGAGIRAQQDGSIIVDGTTTIRDLNRRFDWNLPDEEAATIAGLVLHEAQIIPEAGQTFTFFGYRFEILRRQRHQISKLRIRPPARPAEPTN